MVFFPKEIWNHIFQFDPTYQELYRKTVLPELHTSHTEFIADIFVHFFWDAETILSRAYYRHSFELKTGSGMAFLIEFMNDSTVIRYRVHNRKTGTWYDLFLE